MRILVAHPGPAFSVHDVYVGWVEALEDLGHKVLRYNLDDRLTFFDGAFVQHGRSGDDTVFRKAFTVDQAIELSVEGLCSMLYKTHPDVMLVVSGFMYPAELFDLARHRGTRVVMLHTEAPYEDERQLGLAGHVDLNLLNDPITLPAYEALGPSMYVPHAYRPTLHYPGATTAEYRSDFAFVGTGFASRIAFFEAMNFDGVDVCLAGNWTQLDAGSPLHKHIAHNADECLDNWQTAHVYRGAKVGLNLYRREGDLNEHVGWAMGPREVEMAACGLFFLRDPRPEGDELLPSLPTFASPEEATDLLRFWLADPTRRELAAQQAREAIADRTFHRNATALLDHLERN